MAWHSLRKMSAGESDWMPLRLDDGIDFKVSKNWYRVSAIRWALVKEESLEEEERGSVLFGNKYFSSDGVHFLIFLSFLILRVGLKHGSRRGLGEFIMKFIIELGLERGWIW